MTTRLVGVISTAVDLQRATGLRNKPDFFELRLDALAHSLNKTENALPQLRTPLILTARHPAEGGRNHLDLIARRELLLRFLKRAAFVDLELRSLGELRVVRRQALRRKIQLIVSCHHLDDAPTLDQLEWELQSANKFGAAIFKIATRTDTRAQLDRLLAFFEQNRGPLPIAAMGIGKLGAESRRRLARLGSALLYASISEPITEGQPSLRQLRRLARAYIN